MELTREYQQYILDVLADLCGEQLGVKLEFTLKPEGATNAETKDEGAA